MKSEFHEFRMQTSRWSNRAISPLDFESKSDMSREIVFLHPGWGKKPEMLKFIMNKLVDAGRMPIALDTRFGYANIQAQGKGLLGQKYRVGSENIHFPQASEWDNRYRLRRPTAVLALIDGIEKKYHTEILSASLFGHSEGGRVMTTVAIASQRLRISKLVIANSVGTGDTQGVSGQIKSNFDSNELFDGESFGLLTEAIPSALESTAYAVSHLRRWLREKDVIENANIWADLDEAALVHGVDTTVMHARGDRAISFAEAEARAAARAHITFIPTEGGHSNVYTQDQATLIADQFCRAA